MSGQISAPSRTRLLPALLALVAALLVLAAPNAAFAHDRLVSSDPADGAQLDASPETITLTFSSSPLDVSPMARVTTEDGTVVFDDAPAIDGQTATVTLPAALPAGTATVDWRVVSEDGHPIEGTFSFHVAASATDDASATAAPASDAATAAPTSDTASAAPTTDAGTESANATGTSQDASSALSPGVLFGIVALIALVVAIGVVFVVRGRRRS